MPNLGSFMVRVANFMVSTYEAVAKQFADIQKYPQNLKEKGSAKDRPSRQPFVGSGHSSSESESNTLNTAGQAT